MGRATTDSFVTTVRLLPDPPTARKLRVRFEVARSVYNACLGEAIRRMRLMRESKARQAASAELTSVKGRGDKTASKLVKDQFNAIRRRFGFTEFDLMKWTRRNTKTWVNEHLSAGNHHALASRACKACERSLFEKTNPKFRRHGESISVDGRAGGHVNGPIDILWRDSCVKWFGLTIPASIDPRNESVQHGLSCRPKAVRIVRRLEFGDERFYAQITCEGQTYRNPKVRVGTGIVGVDIGPSTIAVVSASGAAFLRFADELRPIAATVRRLQRKLDRQRRSGNPGNYNADGTPRKGMKKWSTSKAMKRTAAELSELHRKLAEHRRNLHGRLIHQIFSLGDEVHLESLNYKSFQAMFGKSVGMRAPGLFVSRLKQAAKTYGVRIVEIQTRSTRLSQTCHCGRQKKKSLSDRCHECECGVSVDVSVAGRPAGRDLYSAFLAIFSDETTLDVGRAAKAWPGFCKILSAASGEITGNDVAPMALAAAG